MKRRLLAVLAVCCAPAIARAQAGNGVRIYSTPLTNPLSADIGLNGFDLVCSGMTADTAADLTTVRACSAYYGAGTNTTGGILDLAAGVGTKSYTMATFSNCSTDTMTVTVDGAANALVEGTNWNRGASNAASCTSLASAIDALSGVGATCASTTVNITRDSGTSTITVATSDATCATVVNGTDGNLRYWHDLRPGYNGVKLGVDSDGNSALYCSANNDCQFDINGSIAWHATTSSFLFPTGGLVTLSGGTLYSGSGFLHVGDNSAGSTSNHSLGTGGVLLSATTEARGALFVDGQLTTDGLVVGTVQTATINDNGTGANATLTLQPTSSVVRLTCNDAQGCDITMSETGAVDGETVRITNVGSTACNFADTSGVSETTGAVAIGQYDAITFTYQSDRWVEDSSSNN